MNRTKLIILALFALVLVFAPVVCGLSEDDAVLPPNADNVEIHHVKMIDGVMHENHPIIMYKEDFVNEDYDPNKNDSKTVQHKKRRHMHHHRLVEEEQTIPFDTLPDTPIIIDDVVPPKDKLQQKHPKKYRSRQRRQVPYNLSPYYYSGPYQSVYYEPPNAAPQKNYPYQRFPVPGKPPKLTGKLEQWQTKTSAVNVIPDDVVSRLDVDVSNPLHHNSNPADADFSVFNKQRPNPNQITTTEEPVYYPNIPIDTDRDERPSWGPSSARKPNNIQVGDGLFGSQGRKEEEDLPQAPQPVFAATALAPTAAPQSFWRQAFTDALQYPEESGHTAGSSCQRAAAFCCQLMAQLDRLYDCYKRQMCEQSISNIIADCS